MWTHLSEFLKPGMSFTKAAPLGNQMAVSRLACDWRAVMLFHTYTYDVLCRSVKL